MTSKAYLRNLSLLIIIIIIFGGLFSFIIDPLQFYRKAWYTPKLSPEQRYQNPGLAKNYPHSIAIIGSSMTENFLPSEVGEQFDGKAMKLSISGGSAYEEKLTLDIALNSNAIDTVIWGLEYSAFRGEADRVRNQFGDFPFYLYDQNPYNDLQYLLNKDTLLQSIKQLRYRGKETDLEYFHNWNSYVVYSEEQTIQSYYDYRVMEDFPFQEYEWDKLKRSIDKNLIPIIKAHPDINFYLYFPPYSALRYKFFYEEDPKWFYNEIKTKAYIFNKLGELDHVQIFDFQHIESITFDFNNYKDISHHNQTINSLILSYMVDGDYKMTQNNARENLEKLKNQIETLVPPKIKN